MKINEQTRFPHPVLTRDTDDYPTGEFTFDLSVSEKTGSSEVLFEHKLTLTQPKLLELIQTDQAGVGIFVNCRETYYSRLVPLGLADGKFSFEPGALLGRVSIRPIVWSRKKIDAFPLDDCHDEFGKGTLSHEAGAVLALADELIIHAGRDKLAQIESIFTIAKDEQLQPGTLSVFLDDERIRILCASDIYKQVNDLRDATHGKPIVLNSVFLPAIMQVIDSLKDGTAAYEGKRWYKVFDAKCAHLSINVKSPDLWRDAQKILLAPFQEIATNKILMEI